jgi:hypothetical protein
VVNDPTSLRNRLIVAAGIWRESTGEPLPRLEPAEPAQQIEAFEIKLIEMLCRDATPETAREVAERTWDLVHERPDSDPVKKLVVERHEELVKLSHTHRW